MLRRTSADPAELKTLSEVLDLVCRRKQLDHPIDREECARQIIAHFMNGATSHNELLNRMGVI
ncbi:MAG: hypothetical protein KF874_06215 [Rhizobiaceae bacterium]|nr:hypothetical protein [Rhizobiaceae bacterium]